MNVDNKIFDFAYKMAFHDATMRKAFPRREDEKNDDNMRMGFESVDADLIR